MKKTAMAMLLVAAPLAAQNFEVGLFLGQQSFKTLEVAPLKAEVDSKTVAMARFGYALVDLGPALLQVTAGYQPEAKATYKGYLGGTLLGTSEYKHSAAAVGAMFNFKAFVAVGAGIEYRFEKLSEGSDSTNYARPWARANLGVAFPTPLVKPFVGIEAALPLASKSNETGSVEDVLKSNAPKLQVGIYGGIRF